MTPAELRCAREYLGLTHDALAAILHVNPRTVRGWETGRDPIPEGAARDVHQINQDTYNAEFDIIDAVRHAQRAGETSPAAEVYRTDEEFRNAHPEHARFTARWWRHLVGRVWSDLDREFTIVDAADWAHFGHPTVADADDAVAPVG